MEQSHMNKSDSPVTNELDNKIDQPATQSGNVLHRKQNGNSKEENFRKSNLSKPTKKVNAQNYHNVTDSQTFSHMNKQIAFSQLTLSFNIMAFMLE